MYFNRSVMSALLVALVSSSAWAIPVLSIDLDISTPGVQGSRDALLGETVDIAVLLSNYDAATRIDTVSFDLNYNDSGMVLAGVGSPVAGALVDMSPTETWDAVALSFTDLVQGQTLSTQDFGVSAGYLSNFGYFSYSSIMEPFGLTGSSPITVAMFSIAASALGSSALQIVVSPSALAFEGDPVDVSLGRGRINVLNPNSIPEPGILLIFAVGLAGLWTSRSHYRKRTITN